VQLDIASGMVTADGAPDTAPNGCYACLVMNSCLDTSRVHDQECGDLPAAFMNSSMSVDGPSTCVATLQCIVGSAGQGCAANSAGVAYCYCGNGGEAASGGCNSAAGGAAANGACIAEEVAGFPYTQTDSADITANFTQTTIPAGLANSIIGCAILNSCTACTP
jgi:hypothetical protein